MYDAVASRLSEELLAALAWSARTPPPTDKNDAQPVAITHKNLSSTPVSPSPRKSWELFLAQVVTNLTSAVKAVRQTTVRQTTPPTEHSPPASTNRPDEATETTVPVAPSGESSPNLVDTQQQQQQQLLALRSHHLHHRNRASRVGLGRHTRPGLPLNLKSPPAVMLNRLELSTVKPAAMSWRATTRLPPVTTPPAYLHRVHPPVTSVAEHIQHQQHHHHHRQQVVRAPAAGSHNPINNVSHAVWSKPANRISAASLFRTLGLMTGSDANMTSPSMTVADMMRYVLSQSTRYYGAGTSTAYLLFLQRRLTTLVIRD